MDRLADEPARWPLVAWCFYDLSTPKVNLYWFGTIMAIGMSRL
ncbi:MAG: hypothetical protein ACLRWP_05650 [Bilophila wadsworthia]